MHLRFWFGLESVGFRVYRDGLGFRVLFSWLSVRVWVCTEFMNQDHLLDARQDIEVGAFDAVKSILDKEVEAEKGDI